MNTASENIPTNGNPTVITPENHAQAERTPTTAPTPRNAARQNIVVGALWCVGGIIVTAATYNAVKDTGGTFLIAWGAILFGGIQFLKGLIQLGE
jgi:hypothetical protein